MIIIAPFGSFRGYMFINALVYNTIYNVGRESNDRIDYYSEAASHRLITTPIILYKLPLFICQSPVPRKFHR